MATSTYQSGLIRDFWTGVNQRRGRGRDLTSREIESLVNPMLSYQYQQEMAAADRAESRRRFDVEQQNRQEVLDREKEAAQAQGLVNIGGLYGQYKVGMATADALKGTAIPSVTGGAAGSGAAETLTGAAQGGISTGGGGLAEAQQGLTESLVPSTYSPVAAEATAEAAPSLLATTGEVAGPAALAGGIVSQGLLRNESDLVQAAGGAVTGAIVGYIAAGAAAGPAGAIVGGIIGAATSLVDDVSVICTELKRQGLLDPKMHRASTMYCFRDLDIKVFDAYREHADKIVPKMQKSKFITYLALPFGRAMARECAHRYNPEKWRGSVLGKCIEKYLQLYVKVQEMRGVEYATR